MSSETINAPIDKDGLQELGDQVARPEAVHGPDQAAATSANKLAAKQALQAVANFAGQTLESMPAVLGDNSIAAARSKLAFVIRQCNDQARLIGG